MKGKKGKWSKDGEDSHPLKAVSSQTEGTWEVATELGIGFPLFPYTAELTNSALLKRRSQNTTIKPKYYLTKPRGLKLQSE